MSNLALDEIEFHPTSFCDGNGRVFWSKGQLYRGIPAKCAEFTRRIFADGIVTDLVAKKFIPPTTLTDASSSDYPVILHHERVPFVTYAYEWSPAMVRDAALFAIRLLRELAPHGLTLTDAAPWNILFAGCQPSFVDFSSIIDARDDPGRLKEDLQSYYLRSLELFAHGHGHLARLLLTDYEHGPISASFDRVVGGNGAEALKVVSKIWRRGSHAVMRRSGRTQRSEVRLEEWLPQIEDALASFSFPQIDTGGDAKAGSDFHIVERVLRAEKSASVLVAGSGDGVTAFKVAQTGAHVVAIDRDERRVDALYARARAEAVNILPLVVDLRYPAPGHGVENNVLAPALARLRCDAVVALGLIPSLVFAQHFRFEQIAGTLSQLALRTLLIEFPSEKDPRVTDQTRDPYFGWFNLENFVQALRKHFESIQTERSGTAGATMLICEKGVSV